MKRYANPRQTLIFILIGVTLMILLDVFVLKGWRPYHDTLPEKTVQAEIVLPEQVSEKAEPPGPEEPAAPVEAAKPVKTARAVYGPPRPNPNSIERNAVAVKVRKGTARVVIIIDDMGVDKRSREVVGIQPPLTLAYLPYASNLKSQTAEARAAGHELMIHVPMQPLSEDVDPGPNVLTTGMNEEELMAALNGAFASFDGYVGINNHMGSKMTQDREGMEWVMAALKKHKLLFVDSKTIPESVAADTAARYGVPYLERDVFLDHNTDLESVRASLKLLEKVALQKGYAVAIGHPKENTIAALKEWLPTLEEKGISLVPVSQAVRRRPSAVVAAQEARSQSPSPQPE